MTKAKTNRSIVALAYPKQVAVLIALAKAIVAAMTTNNSYFPSPEPTLAAVTTAIADLEAAETAVQSRAKGAVQARDLKLAALIALLQQLKTYVQKIGDNDREHAPVIIRSAGMNVKRSSGHAKHSFGVKHGTVSGSVALVTAVAGRRASYEWEFSNDGGKTWQGVPATLRSRTEITGLQPGSSCLFRSRSITTKGASDWTQPATLIVQ